MNSIKVSKVPKKGELQTPTPGEVEHYGNIKSPPTPAEPTISLTPTERSTAEPIAERFSERGYRDACYDVQRQMRLAFDEITRLQTELASIKESEAQYKTDFEETAGNLIALEEENKRLKLDNAKLTVVLDEKRHETNVTLELYRKENEELHLALEGSKLISDLNTKLEQQLAEARNWAVTYRREAVNHDGSKSPVWVREKYPLPWEQPEAKP